MPVERLSFVLPVADLDAAVAFWSALLEVDPTFVDGDRWAQFDYAGARLALAGTDRVIDQPGLMLKVAELGAACDAVRAAGRSVSDITIGAHERRCTGTDTDEWPIIMYETLK